jgi:hypothetical protein
VTALQLPRDPTLLTVHIEAPCLLADGRLQVHQRQRHGVTGAPSGHERDRGRPRHDSANAAVLTFVGDAEGGCMSGTRRCTTCAGFAPCARCDCAQYMLLCSHTVGKIDFMSGFFVHLLRFSGSTRMILRFWRSHTISIASQGHRHLHGIPSVKRSRTIEILGVCGGISRRG